MYEINITDDNTLYECDEKYKLVFSIHAPGDDNVSIGSAHGTATVVKTYLENVNHFFSVNNCKRTGDDKYSVPTNIMVLLVYTYIKCLSFESKYSQITHYIVYCCISIIILYVAVRASSYCILLYEHHHIVYCCTSIIILYIAVGASSYCTLYCCTRIIYNLNMLIDPNEQYYYFIMSE